MWLKLILYVIEFIVLAWSLFTPSGRNAWAWFFNNVIAAALGQAKPLLAELAPSLASIVAAFADAFSTTGPSLASTVAAPAAAFAAKNFATAAANLTAAGESTADNALDQAGKAISDAFGLGMSSAAVTAAFEALFPERLNTLNGIGPMLAQMAGFADISAAIRDPLYRAAFGKSAEYHFNSIFTPNLPDAHTAAQWLARGIIGTAEFNILYVASGLKEVYSPNITEAAYRPLQPRMFAALLADENFPTDVVNHALTFAGIRPEDKAFLLAALQNNSTKAVRQQYLSALERSVELGTDTPAALAQAMASMNYSDDAQSWVQLTVAERKLEQLAELYRKSITEAYMTGQITDAQYVPSLEAVGIDAADAEAHYAVDSIRKTGKVILAATRATAALERRQASAAMRAAIATYRAGAYDAAELEAALIAAGIDPIIATYAVEVQAAHRLGPMVYIFGQELTRNAALVLREQVTALGRQTTAQLVTPAQALTALAGYGVPDANAKALVANWAATTTTPARVGVLLPR